MKKKLTLMTAGFLALLGSTVQADGHHEGTEAAIALGRAGVSVQEVIDKVATESKGRVVEVHFEEMDSLLSFGDGPLVYEAHAVTPEGIMEYMVDPKDGTIISRSKESLGGLRYRNLPDTMQLTLKQAVDKAEKNGGKVISAELEKEDGTFLYHIRINEEGTGRTLLIDPLNGNIYPVSGHHSDKDEGDHES